MRQQRPGNQAARRARAGGLVRWLDRWLGIPLVLVVGLLRRRRPRGWRHAPRRIAVLKTAAIGDTILLEPCLRALAQAGQAAGAEVRLFCGGSNHPLTPLLPLPVTELRILRPWQALAQLRRWRPDLVIDAEPWARVNALLAAASGARCVGFATPGEHRHAAYDQHVVHRRSCHEWQNYRRLFATIGVQTCARPRLPVPTLAHPPAAGPYLVLHPWSGGWRGERKEWPAPRWAALAQRARAAGWTVVLSGGPGDRARAETLQAQLPAGTVNVAGAFDLGQLAAVLAAATAVVSVNTGVLHLAAAVGAPVVGINGPVPRRRWGALGPTARNCDAPGPGCPYLHLGFEDPPDCPDCMERIDVDRVWRAVHSLQPTPLAIRA